MCTQDSRRSLIDHPSLRYLLRKWKSWSDAPQEAADWVRDQIDGSKAGLFKILEAFYYDDNARKGYLLNLEEGPEPGRYMVLDELSGFASVEGIKNRLEQMSEENFTLEQKGTRHAFYLAYDDWKERQATASRLEPEPEAVSLQEPEPEIPHRHAAETDATPQHEPTPKPGYEKP